MAQRFEHAKELNYKTKPTQLSDLQVIIKKAIPETLFYRQNIRKVSKGNENSVNMKV